MDWIGSIQQDSIGEQSFASCSLCESRFRPLLADGREAISSGCEGLGSAIEFLRNAALPLVDRSFQNHWDALWDQMRDRLKSRDSIFGDRIVPATGVDFADVNLGEPVVVLIEYPARWKHRRIDLASVS